MHEGVEDCCNLSLFMSTLRRYNTDKPLNSEFKLKVEQYFKYRWSQDKMLT